MAAGNDSTAQTPGARCDVLVIGGGVCGLWTLHTLRDAGFNAWLVERSALGDGQTIASQGILHAGTKYDLPGNAADASEAVAAVQPIWEDALAGRSLPGVPDLSAAKCLARETVYWTRNTIGSRIAAEGAKRTLRTTLKKLPRERWPLGFEQAPRGVKVYRAPETVLEPGSLLNAMRHRVEARARVGRVQSIEHDETGVRIRLASGPSVSCSAVVLCAGEGNESLIDLAGGDGSALMQRRPLHQLVAAGTPFPLNGHCLKLDLDKPELTVTTGELGGLQTWYFGGGPAEEGVGRSPEAQIEAGKAAVSRSLPWVDQASFSWRVFEIDRAEGRQPDGKRPNEAVVEWAGERVMAAWPTKLVLAPRAAGLVLKRLRDRGITPGVEAGRGSDGLDGLPEAPVAARVW